MYSDVDPRDSFTSFVKYGKFLLKWSWLMILIGLIAAYGAYYYANLQPRIYQSSTVVVVNMPSGVSDIDPTTQSLQLTTTYANTMITRALLGQVAEKLGYPVTGSISAAADITSPIIQIVVKDRNPQKAADTANAVASVFIEEIDSRQSERYIELETSIENEIARIDEELVNINEKLANLEVQNGEHESETSRSREETSTTPDTETIVMRSQLELSLSQYTQTRYSLVYNLQQIKLSEIRSKTVITQLDPAVPNATPIYPQPVRSAAIGGVAGLGVIGGLVFLITYLKDEIHDPREITQLWGIPILGFIPRHKKRNDSIISMAQPRAPIVEAYRVLRTNLQFANVDDPLNTILITSPSSGDGKSSVAANLAVVTGQNNADVLLVDCDLRKPSLHKLFDLSNHRGLTSFLFNKEKPAVDVVKPTKTKGLFVITSGGLPPNPSELLNSQKMTSMLKAIKQKAKTVILDSPPLLIVADALALAPRVDGVILVVDLKRTKRSMLIDAIKELRQVNAKLLGVVVNRVKEKRSYNYYSRKYYGEKNGKFDMLLDDFTDEK